MISITSNVRGAKIITEGNVSRIVEPVTGIPLGVTDGDTAIEAHTKALYKVAQILGPETAVAKKLADRFLI